MDVEHLIGTMIQGALAGGGKRSRGAHRYLRGGRSSFLNASTLLTLGGLAWGVIETMQQQGAGTTASGTPAPSSGGATPAPPATPSGPPPPLPGGGEIGPEQPPVAAAPAPSVPEGAARLIRLMVSAARADGELSEAERAAILQHARTAGAEALVTDEMARPTPLRLIVDGIADAQQRADLYVLAYGIVRADESVSGSERIYLAQLATLLDLQPDAVEQLERDAAARIDEAGKGQ
jgi:uncharacterized membrane protein YebE (DUF533 family)